MFYLKFQLLIPGHDADASPRKIGIDRVLPRTESGRRKQLRRPKLLRSNSYQNVQIKPSSATVHRSCGSSRARLGSRRSGGVENMAADGPPLGSEQP
ncbi:unnamed protein product [Nesidiocoris tenuis]|uniref:Uncharacterized protein n=1 Tax=Nesidiocoris tenuis TaxID=355587 RepID=A0A6H5GDX4_9HEMI|nr:unnamed protein product [Nesidiocoris tenuis]